MFEELLVNVAIDWVLFSFVESIWFYLCFIYIGNLNKMKWYEIGIMGIGNAFLSQIFPPVIYQVVIIFWMITLLRMNNKNNLKYDIFKLLIFISSMLFTIEILYSIFLKYSIKFEGLKILNLEEKFKLFLLMIPIKIFEFAIIIIIKKVKEKKKMKFVLGTGVTRK